VPLANKPCERCNIKSAVPPNRYCGDCRKLVIKELREAGLIGPVEYNSGFRGPDARENRRETKYGTDD
jgi:hypothetical protein